MLLQHSRRDARTDATGDLVLIADQDRRLWDRGEIAEGIALVNRLMARPEITAYGIEAAIAAQHAIAASPDATNWGEIVKLYDLLLRADARRSSCSTAPSPSPMRDGPESEAERNRGYPPGWRTHRVPLPARRPRRPAAPAGAEG